MASICPSVNPLWGIIPAGAVMIGVSRIEGVTPEAALLLGLLTTLGVLVATKCPEPAMAGAASVFVSYFITRQAAIACPTTQSPQQASQI